MRATSVAGIVGSFLLLFAATAHGESYNPRADLMRRYPEMAALRKQARPLVAELQQRLSAAEAAGKDASCGRQAMTELQWRLGYTADVAAARALLARTQAIAADPHPPSALVQDDEGSYGACVEPWFYKVDFSSEQLLDTNGWPGKVPPRFLDRINDPERLLTYLDSILISDIAAQGIDRRKELNEGTATIVRVIVRGLPREYALHPGLKPALMSFIARWQDPETGFFGAWYRIDDGIVKTTDLSLTFHLASYLDGAIGHWEKLADTLLRIKNDTYPNGWLDSDGMTNHNNYDVVALFKRGWPQMRVDQREAAGGEIARMLEWCLSKSILPDGTVQPTESGDSVPDNYYFAAAFLDTIGYLDAGKRFWTDKPLPDGGKLREQLRRRVESFDPSNPMVPGALRRLR
jgi:hypothetical protein